MVLLKPNSETYSLHLGELPYEKVSDVRWQFLFWPLRGTKKGVVQAFIDLQKATKLAAYEVGNMCVVIKGFILSWKFTSPAPEPLSSYPKCYCLMFGTLSGTWTWDFAPKQYDKHPWPFHMGAPPPPPPPPGNLQPAEQCRHFGSRQ